MLFFLLGYFLALYPHNSPKTENFLKMKKKQEVSSFYTNIQKIIIILYTVPEMWCVTDVIIFRFGLFFCPFTSLACPKNEIFKKMKKAPGDIIILQKCATDISRGFLGIPFPAGQFRAGAQKDIIINFEQQFSVINMHGWHE